MVSERDIQTYILKNNSSGSESSSVNSNLKATTAAFRLAPSRKQQHIYIKTGNPIKSNLQLIKLDAAGNLPC